MVSVIPQDAVEVLDLPPCRVGESIRWHERQQTLYHVDILGQELRAFDVHTGDLRRWPFEGPVGAWLPTDGDELLLAVGMKLFLFDPETGTRRDYFEFDEPTPPMRLNDARCDAQGRLWISTMSLKGPPRPSVGRLIRFEHAGTPEVVLEGISIPNALAWNLEGTRMYFADSPKREVWQFEYDQASGEIGPSQSFFQMDATREGIPDGACTDEDGGIWIAMARDGARLERRMPDGSLDTVVELPVARPTMCAFGGPNRDILYVTSLSPPAGSGADPQNGGRLLSLMPGQRGITEAEFRIEG